VSKPSARALLGTIKPYVQGASEIAGVDEPIKLSSNESPWGPSPAAIEAYLEVAERLARYPDGSQRELRQALAAAFGLDAARIVCGNGSDEVILLLMRAFLAPGEEVIVSEHSFVMCRTHALAQGARVVMVAEPDYSVDVDAILRRVSAQTRMVTIASPNNPCGRHVPAAQLRSLHAGLPRTTLLLCDAAYAEFATADDYDCGFELARTSDNVMITRTFSKLHGLAALRIGWGYAATGIIEAIDRIRTPFNTNAAALAAALAALGDSAYAEHVRQLNATERERLTAAYLHLGLFAVPSSANFVLVRFPGGGAQASAAFEFLKARGILVRPTGTDTLHDHLRITIGTSRENDALLAALTDFMHS
jgi:histidinol-phosphate aminotransferase